MKYRIYIISVVISSLFSCGDDSTVKEALSLHTSSSIQIEKKINIIDDQTTNQYSFIKGDNVILEYIKNYNEKNSIDEEYWSKLLVEFNEKDIDYNKEYLINDGVVNVYLQSGSFDGLIDYKIERGSFSIEKNEDSFILVVSDDIIGIHDEIRLVFAKKGNYEFYR